MITKRQYNYLINLLKDELKRIKELRYLKIEYYGTEFYDSLDSIQNLNKEYTDVKAILKFCRVLK